MSEASGKDPGCVQPRRALVSPRVRAWPGGEALPLEMHVRELLDRQYRGLVNLFGGTGSGKKTALNHLVAVFGERIALASKIAAELKKENDLTGLIVFATPIRATVGISFEMEPWGEDDCIEYLLHVNREKCKSVMERIRAAEDRVQLGGVAQLWVIALDEFLADEALVDIGEALRRHVRRVIGDPEKLREAGKFYFQFAESAEPKFPVLLPARLLRHAAIGIQLAADYLVERLAADDMSLVRRMVPKRLIQVTGRILRMNLNAVAFLEKHVRANVDAQPMGASLLLAADPAWRPANGELSQLLEAELDKAQWPGFDLSRCRMAGVHLKHANLEGAKLVEVDLGVAHLQRANLTGSDLDRANLSQADLSRADLSGASGFKARLDFANLEGANLYAARFMDAHFQETNLAGAHCRLALFRGAVFERANVEGADFSFVDFCGAQLRGVQLRGAKCFGAMFCQASLSSCDMEGMELPQANFSGADLLGSYLTGSVMPHANFSRAKLRQCGLAEVSWEGADLSGADFRGATFHMGSTRSGLVQSVIASEGTRKGFYTDDYNEQDYKAPEEIRKANLCGCDLRDAIVELTDFYLVDLRGAKYSEEQGRHFARCGAILRARK